MERLLGIDRGELPPLGRLALVHAALGGALAAGDATVLSVFLARAGADWLPVVLLGRALCLPLLAALYARLARGRSPRAVLGVLATLGALGAIGARGLMELEPGGAMAAYVVHEVVGGLLTVHWGVYLLASLSGERALRGVSMVYAGARLGAAVAGGVLLWLFGAVAAPDGMWVSAGMLLLLAPLAVGFGRPGGAEGGGAEPTVPETLEDDVARPSLRPGESSRPTGRLPPLLVALVLATVLMVWTRFVLRYQQQAILEGIPEQRLAQLLAGYVIGANLVTALLQGVVMSRLLPRVGLTRANGAYAGMVVAAQAALLLWPGLGAAFFARFTDDELKHAVKTPVSGLFYEAFPPERRAGARAVVLAVASPAAQAVGALGLLALVAGAPLGVAVAAGAALSLAFAGATWLSNRRYERAIRRGSLPRGP